MMRVYRILWRGAVCVLVMTGVVIASAALSWKPLLGLSLLTAILGPLFVPGPPVRTRGGTAPLRYMLATDVCAVLGAIAMAGFVELLGSIALLGVGLVILSCPAVLRLLLFRTPQRSVPEVSVAELSATSLTSSAPSSQHIPLPPLSCHKLSDSELCWRWRTSFAAFQHTVSNAQRLHLIETRAALLDELARRNPDGFSRWLNNGARAASDPASYFTSTHRSLPLPRPPHRDADR